MLNFVTQMNVLDMLNIFSFFHEMSWIPTCQRDVVEPGRSQGGI